MAEIIIKKWLADKKSLPTSFKGRIIRETQKAYQIEILECHKFCQAFKDFQEEAEVYEYASNPCDGCLSRFSGDCRKEWFPKSQIEVEEK